MKLTTELPKRAYTKFGNKQTSEISWSENLLTEKRKKRGAAIHLKCNELEYQTFKITKTDLETTHCITEITNNEREGHSLKTKGTRAPNLQNKQNIFRNNNSENVIIW